MTNLACETETGRLFVDDQEAMMPRIAEAVGMAGCMKPLSASSPVDVFIYDTHERVCALGEIKSRKLDLNGLRRFGSYLVTYQKLLKMINIGRGLGLDTYLFVHLLHDDSLVWWHISDPRGMIRSGWDVKETTTQATCVGGEAVRANAYLSLDNMKLNQP